MHLHARSLSEHGGSSGIRGQGGLESAIAQAQAFLDGNKRMAIGAALLSLEVAGISIATPHTEELQSAMIAIAERRLDKPGLAALFRQLFA